MTIQIAVSNCNFPTTQNNTITFSDGTTSPKITCGTTLFDLRSTLNSGFIFQWKKDDVNIFNQNFTNLTTIEPGQYTLATVSLSNCTNESISNSLTIKKEDESLKIFSTSAIVCDTQNVVLSNSENTIVKWYQNDTFIADNTQIIIGDSATYSIKSLTSTCPNAADSIKIEKFAFSISDYSILPTELNLCISKSETIETVFDTIYEYQWFSNNGILSGKTNSTLQVTEPGTYYLKLSSNDNICTKNLRPLTFLKPGNCINIPQSYLPNVFSPNGDGINDILTFEFAKFDKTTRILLYDRWGTELYQNSLDKFAWDGSIKGGKQADPGIYIVVFENPTLKLKHPVSLVR
jgi:gliding motility-associated-like protein